MRTETRLCRIPRSAATRRVGATRKLNRTAGALLAAVVLSGVLIAFPGTARPAYPGSNGKLAFASERDGGFEIYLMDADGSGPTRLTNNPADDREPAWSPDGSKIAFARNFEIYVMDATGSGQTQLTHKTGGGDEFPTWSPDGSKIAFTHYGAPFGAIYVMNADGSSQTALTNNPDGNDFEPAWSPVRPDGSSRIAFVSTHNFGHSEIYVMNPDGSGQTQLTNDPAANDFAPDRPGRALTSSFPSSFPPLLASPARRFMESVLRCDCGFEARADNEPELVARVQGHALEVHGMEFSPEDVLRLAIRTGSGMEGDLAVSTEEE
jgi:predicted small metal-binding protein